MEENIYSTRSVSNSSCFSNSSNNIEVEDPLEETEESSTILLSLHSFAPSVSFIELKKESEENEKDESNDSISSMEVKPKRGQQRSPTPVLKFPEPVSFDFGFVSPLPKLNTVANFTEKTLIKYIKHEDDQAANEESSCASTARSISNVLQPPQTLVPSINDKIPLNEKNRTVVLQSSFKEENAEKFKEPNGELTTETPPQENQEARIFNVKSNFVDKRVISYIPRPTNDIIVERTKINQYHERQTPNYFQADPLSFANRIPESEAINLRKDQNLKKLSDMKRLKREELKACNSNLGC